MSGDLLDDWARYEAETEARADARFDAMVTHELVMLAHEARVLELQQAEEILSRAINGSQRARTRLEESTALMRDACALVEGTR